MSDPEVDELKERIAHTREELGETVEALAAKADVKARASGAVHDAVDGAKAKVHSLTEGAKDKVAGARDTVRDKAHDAGSRVRDTAAGVRDRVVDVKDKTAEVGARTVGVGEHGGRHELVVEPDGTVAVAGGPGLDRRVQVVLAATALGAVVGAVLVWLLRRRS